MQPFAQNCACNSPIGKHQAAVTHETQFPLYMGVFSTSGSTLCPSRDPCLGSAGSLGAFHTQQAGSTPDARSPAKSRSSLWGASPAVRSICRHRRGVEHRECVPPVLLKDHKKSLHSCTRMELAYFPVTHPSENIPRTSSVPSCSSAQGLDTPSLGTELRLQPAASHTAHQPGRWEGLLGTGTWGPQS